MKLLAHVHLYPPTHNAGAEWMLHSILTDLLRRGHECRVIVSRPPDRDDELDGILVRRSLDPRIISHAYRWADAAITHLDLTRQAIQWSSRTGTGVPLVHLIHNDKQLRHHRVGPSHAQLLVHNSRWLQEAESERYSSTPRIIVHPPIDADRYRCEPPSADEGAATLLNLTAAKGAHTLFDLARRMPAARFLAVEGAYGQQLQQPLLTNCDRWANQADVRRVYERTRVLLMPSHYESWGRCAVEAAVSGIPTIAAPTPGLQEALGSAGTFAAVDDLEAWRAALSDLLRLPDLWQQRSEAALGRWRELEKLQAEQLDTLEGALLAL